MPKFSLVAPLLLLLFSLAIAAAAAAAAAPSLGQIDVPAAASIPASSGPGKWTLWGKRLTDDDDDENDRSSSSRHSSSSSVLTLPSKSNGAWAAASVAARSRTAPPNDAPWWAHVASIASSPRVSVVFDEVSEMNGRVTVREAEYWRKETEEGGKGKGGTGASSSSAENPQPSPSLSSGASSSSSPPSPPPPPRYRLLMFGDRHVQSVALMTDGDGRERQKKSAAGALQQQRGVLVAGYARAMAATAVALCEAAEKGEAGGEGGGEGQQQQQQQRRGLLARDARLLVVGAGGGSLPLALAEILSSVPSSPSSSSPSSSSSRSPSRSSSRSRLSLVEAVEIDPVVLRAASTSMGMPEAEVESEDEEKRRQRDAGEAGKKDGKQKKATPEARRRRREQERARHHRRHPPPPPLPRKLLMLASSSAALPPSSQHPLLKVRLGDGFAAVASSEPSSLSAVFLDAFSGSGGGGTTSSNNSGGGGDGRKKPLDSTSPVAFDGSFLLSAARALRPGGVIIANVMTSGGEAERRALVEKLVLRSERAFALAAAGGADGGGGGDGAASPSSFAFVALPPPSPLEEGNVIVAVVKARRSSSGQQKQQQRQKDEKGGRWWRRWSRPRPRSEEGGDERIEAGGEETATPPPPPLPLPTAPAAIAAARARAAIFERRFPLDVEGLLGDEGGRLRPAAEWLRETAEEEEALRGLGGGVLRSEL